ncbi:MAG TPA: hypothetical protein VKE49_14150 [Myxococcaceae bacterium]|nr:hypothetical protein [Myxococcaceae bacterium]
MPRHPTSRELECEERLAARIAELELRLKLLEARVRTLAADESRRKASEGQEAGGKQKPAAPARERPRCPGCLLELPPGRRRDSCVWCGFRFEAVKARASK